MLKKVPLHVQILVGLLLGIAFGIASSLWGWTSFTIDWVKPFGTIFINLLKVVAVPLVIVTIIGGVASLSNIQRLAKIGRMTFGWFVGITLISAIIGLALCLAIAPGKHIDAEKRAQLQEQYANDISAKKQDAEQLKDAGPLKVLQDIVPENFFSAASNNRSMLQTIFFSVLFGIGIVLSPKEKVTGLISFIDGANEVIINMVKMIMWVAPVGAFALIAGLIADMAGDDVGAAISMLQMLGIFAITVILAILILMGTVYPILVRRYMKMSYVEFLKKMAPAQLLAFSTSSSAATLPVTFECVEEGLGVRQEVAGFVLPLGITINMHGTAIHQAVCAVFVAHAFGHDLTLTHYFIIILTASLAAMGSPAVPGAGLIMMLMVFNAIGVPEEGLALILAIDRPLDMIRTVPNVVGDAIVAGIVDRKTSL
jgi:Na+/H+-dicarboxylate symporter